MLCSSEARQQTAEEEKSTQMNTEIRKKKREDGKQTKITVEWKNDRRMSKHVPRLRKGGENRNTKILGCDMSEGMHHICCQDSNSAQTHFTVSTPGAHHVHASHCSLSWLHLT